MCRWIRILWVILDGTLIILNASLVDLGNATSGKDGLTEFYLTELEGVSSS